MKNFGCSTNHCYAVPVPPNRHNNWFLSYSLHKQSPLNEGSINWDLLIISCSCL